MQQTSQSSAPGSKGAFGTGWLLGAIPSALLLFSGTMKLVQPQPVLDGFTKLGWPDRLALPLGILELTCTLLYLFPRTAVLGAVLLTGYMGGAIATHVRIGEPFVAQAGIGILLWLGLYLRDHRLRRLLPLRVSA